MKYSRLKLDKTGLELGTRGSWAFPVTGSARPGRLSHYEGGRFECHFHPETEMTLIAEGEMYYQANEKVFLLREGDGIFVNSNVMHAGWLTGQSDCAYLPMNFATVMVSGHENSRIEQLYVEPVLRDNLIPFAAFFAKNEEDRPILSLMWECHRLLAEKQEGYELLVKATLCQLWFQLYMRGKGEESVCPDRGVIAVKTAIAHMEGHYAERLTLEELAEVCNFSRSEFCRIFRRYTGRTPFSYLQHLRVRRSLPLLQDRSLSITEVAERAGFAGASYYAEIFRRYMNMSPLQYRKKKE
ncbi:MAG: AraC family transcriptional regulator [Ruminococcaceae bacterium]|nr:AraC family transcriptional regulator [Oscillospiraceae bacterium]